MIEIDRFSSKPYYEQIVLKIKQDVAKKILLPGDRLPSVREFAKTLMMNPNTVSKAYKELEKQQVITTVAGRGTFIKSGEMKASAEQLKNYQFELKELLLEGKRMSIPKKQILQWVDEEMVEEENHGNQATE